ncbi:MAG TPA: Gfo/Idh/MocA family oxidoreductase [Alphaproteobacteria bacterium]|nr:Gfo/Idh/MocA family oxidoreductase [Alphaproteobacteria bacterium]
MAKRRKRPLNVALAGAGMISWYHLTAWRKLGSRVRLVAVCDPDAGRAKKRADEFGIGKTYRERDAMLDEEEIDALDVASPRETHAAWVEAAAARAIDALCQKPMTPTLSQSEALVRRVAGKMRLMIHENWRFRPWFRELKRWIAGGDIGEIVLGRMAMINSGFLPDSTGQRPAFVRQPFMQHEARLMIAEVLIHHLDTMRYLCGDLRVVGSRATRTLADVTGETVAAVFLETPSGAPVTVTGTMAAVGYPVRPPDRLEIVGTKASVMFEDNELRLLGSEQRCVSYDAAEGYQGSFDGVIAHFVDCLESGAPFETGPEDNLETLRLVEHAYWAAGLHQLGVTPSS